jgi:filamentous hemagglutinin family protein
MPRKVHPIPSLTALTCLVLAAPAGAQVTSDGTLGTTVTPSGATTYTITGGQFQGSTTLLQSFGDFSLPNTTDTAHFDLGNASYGGAANGVNTVIGRVTGGNLSTINGQIQLTGGNAPDLFLINPSGIVFGAGATLNVPGSFVASTAENVLFANNVAFGIGNTPSPLLTITAPTGLQLSNPAPITVQGTGHNLTFNPTPTQSFPPFTRETNPAGLAVQPGQTLALVGGNISLTGGQLFAEQGRIELGSVNSGLVGLSVSATGIVLDYSGLSNFQDIRLDRAALIDASEPGGSGIYLTGRQISLTDGSTVLIQNNGITPVGDITVNATESLEILDTTPTGSIRSSLSSETTSSGVGGNIQVSTQRLTLQGGGQILTRGFGTGDSGNVDINASERIDVLGSSLLNPTFFSSIFVLTSGGASGQAGDVTITTGRLRILDGGIVTSSSFGLGSGGNLTLRASESVEVIGQDPILGSPSDLNVATFRTGNAGSMTIDTQQLIVLDGGQVRASTIGDGNAGSLSINAAQLVEVGRNSNIDSSVNANTSVNAVFGLGATSRGEAGGINITTDRLFVHDQSGITAGNIGPSNGGTLAVNANTIFLDQGGTLNASTRSGEGGNIVLQGNALIMRYDSLISTNSAGTGNGGNITLNIPVIAGFENSDIVANAVQGNGGNITITTQGIFGLEFRPQLTPENDITASSQFGVNGTVEINEFSLDPATGIVELPAGLADASDQIAQGCAVDGDSSFVATGRGGIPPSPNERLSSDLTWGDTRDLSEFLGAAPSGPAAAGAVPAQPPGLTEINAWRINANGQVELLVVNADAPASSVAYATCSNPT